jgi:hypothetical protein
VQRKVNAEGLRAEVAKAAAVRRRKPTGSVERRHYSEERLAGLAGDPLTRGVCAARLVFPRTRNAP